VWAKGSGSAGRSIPEKLKAAGFESSKHGLWDLEDNPMIAIMVGDEVGFVLERPLAGLI
jgi:hypothetical protein